MSINTALGMIFACPTVQGEGQSVLWVLAVLM